MKTLTLSILLIMLAGICQAQYETVTDRNGNFISSMGLFGESNSDSSLIGYQVWATVGGGRTDTMWTRFTFDPKHYHESASLLWEYLCGFGSLNVMAQKEYVENLKYIRSMKCGMTRKSVERSGGNKVQYRPGMTLQPGDGTTIK